ncbi:MULTISPECIES: pyridoxamine 5'-phosphate oxidase family protein [unclassified Paenibacillus]|uniref:pyridoxamine 5'-phosphate oxidase family protein n=1 Tax=unclassified Paenibacillus TaxID=185978 RepID=UPI00020D67B5|nr:MULTISPECIES: pyridoxamine 5'-phosphate oxidase family protein [unclassified Paenibacillus]EGL20240.1 pyridoxamine 5'-phosphate oxidase family protein [Paenibacillus sp. HGF7]EPD92308.1 hypothetical protein HMPREF1207_00978 [Paenibacillus sp. HGH0039]
MAEEITALSEQLIAEFHKEKLVLLHTIDSETGAPTANAISWVYAPDPGRIRFAVDKRSRLIANLEKSPSATVTMIAAGTVHAIYAEAAPAAEVLEGVPFKLACYDLNIRVVRDAMFYGARISVDPEFEKTYDKRAADKLDGQVFEAMKKA